MRPVVLVAQVWNGRWAMVGILASIIVEVRTGSGTLEQIGIQGLPSMGEST